MYTLYNTSVELDTRLATAPQPAFHYNTLLASVAINSFFFQQLPGYHPPLGYHNYNSATRRTRVLNSELSRNSRTELD
jgi:hypothetical protein